MQVYTGTNLWFDTVMPVQELPMHPASTGCFGGLEAGDQCFYAFAGHGDGPIIYTLCRLETCYPCAIGIRPEIPVLREKSLMVVMSRHVDELSR